MLCHLYPLKKTTYDWTSRDTGKVKDFFERITKPLRNHSFHRKDPNRVVNLLARFTQKGNVLTLSTEEETTCWPEAVQYLLINYAQAKAISKAVLDLRYIKQRSGEDDEQFSCRLVDAFSHCGNSFSHKKLSTWTLTVWHQLSIYLSSSSATRVWCIHIWKQCSIQSRKELLLEHGSKVTWAYLYQRLLL